MSERHRLRFGRERFSKFGVTHCLQRSEIQYFVAYLYIPMPLSSMSINPCSISESIALLKTLLDIPKAPASESV